MLSGKKRILADFAERKCSMKKLHAMDKLSLAIIVLNVISAISFFMPTGTIWSSLLIGFIFYSVFIMWLSIPIGIILNVISIIKKTKSIKVIWINLLMIVVFLLNIPLYKYLFDYASSV